MRKRILYALFGIWDFITGAGAKREDYVQKHIIPHIKRGQEAGIPLLELQRMATIAVRSSDFSNRLPGEILSDMVDKRISREGRG